MTGSDLKIWWGNSWEKIGAGEGNRTLVVSLGSFCSAIELRPRSFSKYRKYSFSATEILDSP